MKHSFTFLDCNLNKKAIARIKKAGVPCHVDDRGIIHYATTHEERIENDLLSSVRNEVFPHWAIFSCPRNWIASYKEYMAAHRIPYQEELTNNQICFLIPA